MKASAGSRLSPATAVLPGHCPLGTWHREPRVAVRGPDTSRAGRGRRASWAKISLDNIEAVLEDKASKDQQRYRLGDVELQRMKPEELLEWRNTLKALYDGELEKEQIALGKNSKKGFGIFTSR